MGPVWTFTEILLGIIGVICLAVGVVILVADDDQYVGLGGDLTWRVGDIAPAAGWGLLVGGAVLLVVMVAMVWAGQSSAGRVEPTVRPRTELVVHGTAFAIVNAFLWLQDIVAGGGLEYAYWTTIPWGIGLIAHALAYISGRSESRG
ncbi:MAG: 2TM domain-containing protein [Chloroflexota bacterium]